MTKTLLVLAASTYQIPIIRSAKALGYRVVTTDNLPANPGHALADVSYAVDTTDAEGVLAVARTEGVDGVIAAATDVSLASAAFVSDRLGLAGSPTDAVAILTGKQRFRDFMVRAGLPAPKTLPVSEGEIPVLDEPGRRWLIKPNKASGCRGIRILHNREELLAQLPMSRAASLDGAVLLEELIEGTQHTCEGLMKEGEIALALITDRDVFEPPYTTTVGHRVPTILDSRARADTLSMIGQVMVRLGIHEGPFDCDFVWDGERPFLIEMSPRIGGNSLPRLVRLALDFDLNEYAVRHACGDMVTLSHSPEPRPSAVIILGVGRDGSLRWNRTEEEALRREVWVKDLVIDCPAGVRVEPFSNGRNRIGEALIVAEDRAQLDARVGQLWRRLAATAA